MNVVRMSLALVLSACAAAPPTIAVPAALQPFAEAAQFLAPGFESYSFAIDEEPDLTSEVEHYLGVVIARSGSDFEKPKNLGAGPCRGAEVRDYGTARVALPWYRAGEPTTNIAGVPVWLGKGNGVHFDMEAPLWTAIINARFHVRSPDRDVLEAALKRTGRIDEILRPFAAVALVPADAKRILCLRPRPEDSPYWNRPIPCEPMVIALCPPKRLLMFHRRPLPREFGTQFVTSQTVGEWIVDERVVRETTWAWTQVFFGHLFGLAVFM